MSATVIMHDFCIPIFMQWKFKNEDKNNFEQQIVAVQDVRTASSKPIKWNNTVRLQYVLFLTQMYTSWSARFPHGSFFC